MMTRTFTTTQLQIATLTIEDGEPVVVELPIEEIVGKVTQAKAQKILNNKHGQHVTILSIDQETNVYEMPIEQFMKYASIRVERPEAIEVSEEDS